MVCMCVFVNIVTGNDQSMHLAALAHESFKSTSKLNLLKPMARHANQLQKHACHHRVIQSEEMVVT